MLIWRRTRGGGGGAGRTPGGGGGREPAGQSIEALQFSSFLLVFTSRSKIDDDRREARSGA